MPSKPKRNKLLGTTLSAKELLEFKKMCKVMRTYPSAQLRKMALTFAGISDVEVAKGCRRQKA